MSRGGHVPLAVALVAVSLAAPAVGGVAVSPGGIVPFLWGPTVGADADQDLLPDDAEVAVCLAEAQGDPSDGSCSGSRDDYVAPESARDADRDGIVDAAEAGVCMAEDRGDPVDGSCDDARMDYRSPVDDPRDDADGDGYPALAERAVCAAPQPWLGRCTGQNLAPSQSPFLAVTEFASTSSGPKGANVSTDLDGNGRFEERENLSGTCTVLPSCKAALRYGSYEASLRASGAILDAAFVANATLDESTADRPTAGTSPVGDRRVRLCTGDAATVAGCAADSDDDGRLLFTEVVGCSDPTAPDADPSGCFWDARKAGVEAFAGAASSDLLA